MTKIYDHMSEEEKAQTFKRQAQYYARGIQVMTDINEVRETMQTPEFADYAVCYRPPTPQIKELNALYREAVKITKKHGGTIKEGVPTSGQFNSYYRDTRLLGEEKILANDKLSFEDRQIKVSSLRVHSAYDRMIGPAFVRQLEIVGCLAQAFGGDDHTHEDDEDINAVFTLLKKRNTTLLPHPKGHMQSTPSNTVTLIGEAAIHASPVTPRPIIFAAQRSPHRMCDFT